MRFRNIFSYLLLFQSLGDVKINIMVESKDFRKGIHQLEWYVLNCDNSIYVPLGILLRYNMFNSLKV